MSKTIIVGAGLAGLITACKVKDATIYEAGKQLEQHKALLRFRDESVSHVTGIPFRAVTVRKGIHAGSQTYDRCTPAFANTYARKVTGKIAADRSIWNLDTAVRYIAPEDFYDQLVHLHRSRIYFEASIENIQRGSEFQTINTAPLPVIMRVCGLHQGALPEAHFESSKIEVLRYRLPAGSDVFQTLYFPEMDLRTFRASITGDLLIIEKITERSEYSKWDGPAFDELTYICDAFGICPAELEEIERVDQRYGKIIELPRESREAILMELTRDYNVYSIGRFATWRNILLDDVVKDIDIVQRLMAASSYGRELVLANR